MNPVEKLVADLEYCKDLDPKVWRDTVFVSTNTDLNYPDKLELRYGVAKDKSYNYIIPRPTFAEVWAKLLREMIDENLIGYPLTLMHQITGYQVFYKGDKDTFKHKLFTDEEKPVNAAIKLFKWCEENGYL